MCEYREFHRLGNEMPHDCDFPLHCPKRTVHMQDVAGNVVANVDVRVLVS